MTTFYYRITKASSDYDYRDEIRASCTDFFGRNYNGSNDTSLYLFVWWDNINAGTPEFAAFKAMMETSYSNTLFDIFET